MKLHVENFAKIKEADIEIKGITVIAGENNTGKSTIGKILYCLFTAFHNLDQKVVDERKKSIFSNIMEAQNDIRIKSIRILNKIIELLVEIKNPTYENVKNTLSSFSEITITDDLINKILENLTFNEKELSELILQRIFNDEFNKQIFPVYDEKLLTHICMCIKDKKIIVDLNSEEEIIKSKIDLDNDGILIDNPFVIDRIKIQNSNPEYYLINNFFDDTERYRHDKTLINKLSKSLKNNDSLIEEALFKKRIDKFLNMLKKNVHGDFVEKTNKFTFMDEIYNRELELSNLSTGIKSFAIIMKLLENKDIKDKSIILLDEPEIHLHPKWQLIFAEILVLLQKEFNLNIVLTTHSPYFIRAMEVYSAKHDIADKCKYYLAYLDDEFRALFEDVTLDTEKIYAKLAEPFQIIADETYELREND